MDIRFEGNVIHRMEVSQGYVPDKPGSEISRACAQAEPDGGPMYTSNSGQGQALYYQGKGGTPRVLVIANSKLNESKELKGHKQDREALKKMWKEDFNCMVLVEKNLTSDAIKDEAKHFSEHMNGDERYCAVFILSHGKFGDRIVGTDEETVSFDEIISFFDNRNEKLRGIPKLFFFQCCRGDLIDRGIPASTAAAAGMHQQGTLPEVSDTMIMFATQRDKIAIVEENGSWIVKELIDVFQKYHKEQDLTSMLTIVNKRVSEREVQHSPDDPNIVGAKCMSEYRSTLTAKLRLTP